MNTFQFHPIRMCSVCKEPRSVAGGITQPKFVCARCRVLKGNLS